MSFTQKYTEEDVKKVLESEGWELLSSYVKVNTKIIIRNKDVFDGHLCRFTFSRWLGGGRPNMRSLIDKASYVKYSIEKEGWILLNEYKGNIEPIFMYKLDFFDGAKVQFDWSSWNQGQRPNFLSVVDKNEFIKNKLKEEGWELLSEYKGSKYKILIRNPDIFDGHTCQITWGDYFSSGYRPDFRSLVNKTEYIKSVLEKENYEVEDSNWTYKNKYEYFRVVYKNTGQRYAINWDKINSKEFPNKPSVKLKRAMSDFLRKKKAQTFIKSKFFDLNYQKQLKEKFSDIPPNYHIDHIICLSYWGTSMEQMLLANSIENLRLLPDKENISRGNRLKKEDLDEYNLWDLFEKAENPDGLELIDYPLRICA